MLELNRNNNNPDILIKYNYKKVLKMYKKVISWWNKYFENVSNKKFLKEAINRVEWNLNMVGFRSVNTDSLINKLGNPFCQRVKNNYLKCQLVGVEALRS